MGTREKILLTALLLFNKTGIHQQTVRTIADKVGISHGNLCYHFANKWLIVEEIFKEIEQLEPNNKITKLKNAFDLQMAFFKLQIKYQFYFEDLTEIFKHLPTIYDTYRKIVSSRDDKLETMLAALVESDAILPMSKKELSQLMGMHKIFSNFWAIDAKYFHRGRKNDRLNYYHQLNCSMIVPYLTSKGLREYKEYFKNFK